MTIDPYVGGGGKDRTPVNIDDLKMVKEIAQTTFDRAFVGSGEWMTAALLLLAIKAARGEET